MHDLITAADKRIRPYTRETLLEHSPFFSNEGMANVYFKCENLQHTGSFKVRGALNKVLSLSQEDRAKGIVTASTGNHGMAVAYALQQLHQRAIVFVPENSQSTKRDALQRAGSTIRIHGDDSSLTEATARQYAADNGMTFISPYNDPVIVAGQGTIAVELERQLDHIDAVFVSVGGGGMISGIASYLKAVAPHVTITGCSPQNSNVMEQSVQAGKILDIPSLPTLSDGTAGGIEPGAITFPICQQHVDEFVSVTEDEIVDSLRLFMQIHHMMIEGAAAVALAAYRKTAVHYKGKNVVIVLCGANIGLDTLKTVL